MSPQEILALLQVLARQQVRIAELEHEVERLQEMVTAALTKEQPADGVPG